MVDDKGNKNLVMYCLMKLDISRSEEVMICLRILGSESCAENVEHSSEEFPDDFANLQRKSSREALW